GSIRTTRSGTFGVGRLSAGLASSANAETVASASNRAAPTRRMGARKCKRRSVADPREQAAISAACGRLFTLAGALSAQRRVLRGLASFMGVRLLSQAIPNGPTVLAKHILAAAVHRRGSWISARRGRRRIRWRRSPAALHFLQITPRDHRERFVVHET